MQAHTICLRCHQKGHLIAEVIDGKVAAVVDATPIHRTPSCREVCPIGMDVLGRGPIDGSLMGRREFPGGSIARHEVRIGEGRKRPPCQYRSFG